MISASANNLGYLLSKAAKVIRWDLTNRLTSMGLTASQWAVLKDLSIWAKGPSNHDLTPAAIAERLSSDRPTISGIIERLEKQGWVCRAINPLDRRSYIIGLTDKARDSMDTLEVASDVTLNKAIADFSFDEVAALKSYLARIIDNF